MRRLTTAALGALLLAAVVQAPTALGQQAAPKQPKRAPLASPADVEPAVDVGGSRVALIDAPPPSLPAPPTVSDPAAPSVAAAPKPASKPTPPSAQRTGSQPVAAASSAPKGVSSASSPEAAPAPKSRAMDTLDLGTTSITGNQELPKVLYIVPWKKSDLGDLVGRPVNTLLDEVLEPVDPEVFQRHLSYYDALYGKGQKGKE
jgi:hypothetical protein